jgi:hypothetical protein
MKRIPALALVLALLASATLAQATGHSVTLSWTNADTGVTNNMYRLVGACPASLTGTFPFGFTKINTSAIASSPYVDSNVIVASTYCYFATEVLGTQESAASIAVSATIPLGKVTIFLVVGQ